MALFLFVPIGPSFYPPNRSLISQIALCINIYRTLFHSQKRKWLMTNDHNDWNSWSLCFMLATSMFHACGLYVSRLRPLSTTHGYDKGRIAFWGARKRLGALAVLCGFERRAWKHRGCEAGLKHRGWVRAFGLVLFGRAFRGLFFLVVLFVVRSFWSFFSWFVLLVVLLVVLFVVRSSCRSSGSCFWSFFSWFVLWVRVFGSCFWFVLLGARMCFLFDALKFLEACVARSEVS